MSDPSSWGNGSRTTAARLGGACGAAADFADAPKGEVAATPAASAADVERLQLSDPERAAAVREVRVDQRGEPADFEADAVDHDLAIKESRR